MHGLELAPKIKNSVDVFVNELKALYGKGLSSVILYGSAASGEFSDRHSNINLLAILDDTRLQNLKKASGIMARFNTIAPLFFTSDYLKYSTDVFPIEFLDMKENYVVLYGGDVLKDLVIDTKNLRFQCEQELKSKIINIKKAYLHLEHKRDLEKIMFKFLTSGLHIIRNLMRLKGRKPLYSKVELLEDISSEFKVDVGSFKNALRAKTENLTLTYEETEAIFFALVEALEKVSDMLDVI